MRQLCRLLLSFSFCFALFIGVLFSIFIPSVQAAGDPATRDTIGPEVAGAGYTQVEQEALNKALLIPKNYTGIVQFANGVGETPYNPTPQLKKVVIRLVGFDYNTDPQTMKNYGTSLCANQGLFPDSAQSGQWTILLVGNELNNLDLEYKGTTDLEAAGAKYAQQFNAVASAVKAGCGSHFRIAPASPDLYNGVWNPVPWLAAVVNGVSCSNIDVLVANIFEVPPRPETGYSDWKAVYKYIEDKVGAKCGGKRVVHFGGFGPNPNTSPPPTIQSQLEWFASSKADFPAGSVVETATTLLIDPCKDSNVSKSNWLFYVYGKAYDKDGIEVTEDCSKRKKPVFVYPGIEDMQSTAEKNAMAASYMLTCGNKVSLQGDIRGNDKVNDALPGYDSYVDSGTGGVCTPDNPACSFEVFGNVVIDNTKTVIPLFRLQNIPVPRPNEPTRRMDDLEGFFSATYTKKQANLAADIVSPLANGVSRKLTSADMQCTNTVTYLDAIKKLCDEEKNRANLMVNAVGTTNSSKLPPQLASPSASTAPDGECALYLAIPGAKPEFATYREVQEKIPKVSGEKTCSPEWLHTVSAKNKDWYKAFISIEVTTPKGFKPAYIVRYMDRPEEQPSSFTSKVTWLAPSKLETNPDEIRNMTINDRIQITKVYVPAGFAEENDATIPDKKSFFPTYDGGFTQMIKSVLSKETSDRIEALTQQEVKSIVPKVANPSFNSNSEKKYVQCTKCGEIDPGDYRGIIVRRINAQFSTQINFGASLGTPFAGCMYEDYVGETATTKVQTINPEGVTDPVQPRQQTAVARLTAGGTGGGDPQTVRTFFLLPEEYRNVNNYELSFIQTFVSHEARNNPDFDFIARRSERKSPKNAFRYLQLSKSGFDISSPSKKADQPIGENRGEPAVPDPNIPIDPNATPVPPGTTQVYIEGKITGTKGVSEFNPDPQVPGGMLARGLWEMMCNVLRPHSDVATIPYPGFEAFLKEGMAACVKGAKPTTPTGGAGDLAYLSTEVAKCNGTSGGITPGNRIPIVESNHVCTAAEAGAGAVGLKAALYSSALNIPAWKSSSDGNESLCDENFYSFVACSYSPSRGAPNFTLIAHEVDSSGNFKKGTGVTACKYVVQKAQAKGISPRLALAMWGEESGFSAYNTHDFGVTVGPFSSKARETGSIDAQLTGFLNTISGQSDYRAFLRRYSGEETVNENLFCNNRQFPSRLRDFYNDIQ